MNDINERDWGARSRQTAHKPVAEFWYAIQPEADAILRLNEVHVDPYSVGDIWLVRGSTRDLAIDTGSGIVPPASLVEAVSGKAVLAVALNCFYDHAGGWHSFANRACHPLDAGSLENPNEGSAYISVYLCDGSLSALPRPGYSTADYRMIGASPTRLLEDGELIDLGDRHLQVLHTPGRSPGGIVLWEAESGSLFTSDMLYDGAHGPAWPPDEPGAYAASLKRLRALPVSRVYPGHYGPFDAARMRELIDEQLAALARLA